MKKMSKAEKTKSSILRYVDFFFQNVSDYPTQKEVSKNLNIPYRTVQRYYEAQGNGHQSQKVFGVRFKEGAEKWQDIEFDFWRDYHAAQRRSNAKLSFKDFMS